MLVMTDDIFIAFQNISDVLVMARLVCSGTLAIVLRFLGQGEITRCTKSYHVAVIVKFPLHSNVKTAA